MSGKLVRTHRTLIALTCEPSLSKGDVALLALLLEHRNSETGRCDPGRTRLVTLSGLRESTVSRRLAKLMADDWISIKPFAGKHRTNAYELNDTKLDDLKAAFDAKWGGDPEVTDNNADCDLEVTDSNGHGDVEINDMVISTSSRRLPRGHTNPLTNPLINPLSNVQIENQEQQEGANSSDSECAGETEIAWQEEQDTSTQRTPAELTQDEIARKRWRADTTEYFIMTPNLNFSVDKLPESIAEAAQAAELKQRRAGKKIVLEWLATLTNPNCHRPTGVN